MLNKKFWTILNILVIILFVILFVMLNEEVKRNDEKIKALSEKIERKSGQIATVKTVTSISK